MQITQFSCFYQINSVTGYIVIIKMMIKRQQKKLLAVFIKIDRSQLSGSRHGNMKHKVEGKKVTEYGFVRGKNVFY